MIGQDISTLVRNPFNKLITLGKCNCRLDPAYNFFPTHTLRDRQTIDEETGIGDSIRKFHS